MLISSIIIMLCFLSVFQNSSYMSMDSIIMCLCNVCSSSSIFELLCLYFLADTNYISTLASGPYGLIFSSFVPFFLDIPITSRFRIFGLNFSDKSFIYLAGLQLLLSSWKRSLIPGIFGLVAGSLYRLNVFGIRKMKVTRDLFPFCVSVLLVLHCYLMWQIAVNILFACWYCSLIHCPGTYCA